MREPYDMGKPRNHKDAAQDLGRELADIAEQLASLKGVANAWLSDDSYDTLKHRLENSHAAAEAAARGGQAEGAAQRGLA